MPNLLRRILTAISQRWACWLQYGHIWDYHLVTPYQPGKVVTATYKCVLCGTESVSTFHPATSKGVKK